MTLGEWMEKVLQRFDKGSEETKEQIRLEITEKIRRHNLFYSKNKNEGVLARKNKLSAFLEKLNNFNQTLEMEIGGGED